MRDELLFEVPSRSRAVGSRTHTRKSAVTEPRDPRGRVRTDRRELPSLNEVRVLRTVRVDGRCVVVVEEVHGVVLRGPRGRRPAEQRGALAWRLAAGGG